MLAAKVQREDGFGCSLEVKRQDLWTDRPGGEGKANSALPLLGPVSLQKGLQLDCKCYGAKARAAFGESASTRLSFKIVTWGCRHTC